MRRTEDVLNAIHPDLVGEIRKTLVENETKYQRRSADVAYNSLWCHSERVARIAHFLAAEEGCDGTAALLAGLLHDIGKFAGGTYHEDEVPEEEAAAEVAEGILQDTPHAELIPIIKAAILSLYREEREAGGIGRVLYDADRLDKMGYMGVAQFFAKNALRQRFLDDDLLMRASIELTYALHAGETMKTATGRALASVRSTRVRRFYGGLLEELEQLGLGSFSICEYDCEGIDIILVMPQRCGCGDRFDIHTDLRETVKCRTALVRYTCLGCENTREFGFCLPNLKDLPQRREDPR